MTRTRDYQQTAVYSAETIFLRMLERGGVVEIAGTSVTLPPTARFGDIPAVQRYVDQVLSHPAVRDAFGTPEPITVRRRKGTTRAHYESATRTIAIPDQRDLASESVVLHEVAHALSGGGVHDGAFTATLLRLLEILVGPPAAFVLSVLYREGGVDIN